MQVIKYELLVRFDDAGDNPVAMARTRTVLDDGRAIDNRPQTIAINSPEWQDWVEHLSVVALSERDAALAERGAAVESRDSAIAQLSARDVTIESLEGQIENLELQIESMLNPPGPDLSTLEGVREYIRAKRYERQIAGFYVGSVYFSTVRDAQGDDALTFGTLANNAQAWKLGDPTLRALKPNGEFTYTARGRDPVKLTPDQILRAWACMLWYVDECYNAEYQLVQSLRAEGAVLSSVVEDTDSIAETWPISQFEWNLE